MTDHRLLTAATDGWCGRCDEPIRAGQPIALLHDDNYVHVHHLPRTAVHWEYTDGRPSEPLHDR